MVDIEGTESTFAILEPREEVEGDRDGIGEIDGESENGTSGRIGAGESIDWDRARPLDSGAGSSGEYSASMGDSRMIDVDNGEPTRRKDSSSGSSGSDFPFTIALSISIDGL